MYKIDSDTLQKIVDEYVANNTSPKRIKEILSIDVSEGCIRNYLKKAGVYCNRKVDKQSLANRVSKDSFEAYYNEHSRVETMGYFNLTKHEFDILRDVYAIKKDSESINAIRKKTVQSKYGVENVFANKNIVEKIVAQRKDSYNGSVRDFLSTTNAQDVVDFYRCHSLLDTCAKYGLTRSKLEDVLKYVGYTKNSADTAETRSHTNIKKYGTKFPSQNRDIIIKTRETCKDRYGVYSPTQSQTVKDKIRNTNRNKYGVENVFANEHIKQKIRNTNLEKYGVIHPQQTVLSNYSVVYQEMYHDRDKSIAYLINNRKTYAELAEDFACSLNSVIMWVNKFNLNGFIKHNKSHYEDEIIDYIGRERCISNTRTILPSGQEIDIFIPEKNIGIEFNGNYWHSTLCIHDKNYHFNKSLEASKLGIHLLHIYQYEWDNEVTKQKIKMLLDILLGRVSNRIYARNCDIREICNTDAKTFNEITHLQGHRNAQVTYGLFYNGVLVQLMSFSKTKYNRNLKNGNDWEIIRGCPGSNNIVVGGVSKLFSHFIKDYKPDTVFSYCDFNKFNGSSYESIGMKFVGYTGPDKTWFMSDNSCIKRNPRKYRYLLENSKGVIWGSGSKKYVWKTQESGEAQYDNKGNCYRNS